MNSQVETIRKELFSFYQANGHCYVSPRNDTALFQKVQEIRESKNNLELSFIHFLDSIHFDWKKFKANDQHWMFMYHQLMEYKNKHNHMNVPFDDQYKNLYNWETKQRRQKHLLADWRINLLDQLGFEWKENHVSKVETKWLNTYHSLLSFRQEFGHTRVSSAWRDQHLAKWVQHQREREKSMPSHRKKLLDDIGFSWFEDTQKDDERRWEENFRSLLQFKEKNNHLIVPDIEFYQKLNTWIYRQRKEEKTMSKYHKQKLNAIGFRWKKAIKAEQIATWNKMYEELDSFYKKHGHCRITYHKEYTQLRSWVYWHRKYWDKLDKKTRNKLETLNFNAPSGVDKNYRQRWISMLAKLKKFKNEFGHCRVPQNYVPNPSLGKWVHSQRLSENKLADWKKRQLMALDFEWSSVIQNEKNNYWNEMYTKLVKFYERFGHSSVPGDWKEDIKLAKWVIYQRHSIKPLSKEKVDLLKQVKFEFKANLSRRKRNEKGHFIKLTSS
jgi:hypothetical protein